MAATPHTTSHNASKILVDGIDLSDIICSYTMSLSLRGGVDATLSLSSAGVAASARLRRFTADHLMRGRPVTFSIEQYAGTLDVLSMATHHEPVGGLSTVTVTSHVKYLTPLTGEEN